jgi:hypothetical protein
VDLLVDPHGAKTQDFVNIIKNTAKASHLSLKRRSFLNEPYQGAVGKDCQRQLLSRPRFVRACSATDYYYYYYYYYYQGSHAYKTTYKITVLHILIFTTLNIRQEDKNPELHGSKQSSNLVCS